MNQRDTPEAKIRQPRTADLPWWRADEITSDAVGRSHGTSRSTPFDRWFRYPAGFASDYAERLFERIGVRRGTVVDPFMGSAVTGTAARSRGLKFVGIEAHPLIADLARAKLHLHVAPSALASSAAAIAEEAQRQVRITSSDGVARAIEAETELVRRSFDPVTLYTLIAIREALVGRQEDLPFRYLKWALLGTLRDVAAVKVGWPYQRPALARRPRFSNAAERFVVRASAMAQDMMAAKDEILTATILCGDAASSQTWAAWTGTGCASVSSPPYLNNFDYADATRLEMYFWGVATTWKELCDTARRDMIVATTQQSSKTEKQAALDQISSLGTAGAEVKELTELLTQQRAARGRGAKAYDQVVPVYFVQMRDVLCNMARRLKSGSRCAWLIGDSAPYGVYVDTPRLVGAVAEGCGYVVRADHLLRTRGHRWSAAGGRHEVKLGERLLIFERI